MHRRQQARHLRWPKIARLALLIMISSVAVPVSAQALNQAPTQAPTQAAAPSLLQAFEAAWLRQPEAAALNARREAAQALQQVAQSWTPEPVAVELAGASDRLNRNLGAREFEVGLAVPLWLPGERDRSQAQAAALGRAVESQATAAQLRLAASVREAWWNWQRARAEVQSAAAQLSNAQRIAADVQQRLQAGDLARADMHQAEGATAAAEATNAQAQAELIHAQQQLLTLTMSATGASSVNLEGGALDFRAEAEPYPTQQSVMEENHAALLALKDSSVVAASTAALAAAQSRANPELTLSTTRDRGAAGDAWQQTFRVGVRIPFGAGPRQDARTALARADLLEQQAQLSLERARVAGEGRSAKARTDAARLQLTAADRRAQLAAESRGFFQKSFSLGQTDLPTRLRIEAEAAEAERHALRARIELSAAVSAWRQALGLLPQ